MKRLIAYLLLVCVYAGAPVSALPEARTKVRSLAAFKNGLGFVFRTGETQLQDGWAMIEPVPPAVLGTYWVGTTNPQARVTQVVSFNNKERRPANAMSFGELLAANVGKEVTIVYAPTSEAQTIRGTVIAFPKRASEAPSTPGSFVRNPPPDTSQIVLLKTSDGQTLALDKTFIRQVTKACRSRMGTRGSRGHAGISGRSNGHLNFATVAVVLWPGSSAASTTRPP